MLWNKWAHKWGYTVGTKTVYFLHVLTHPFSLSFSFSVIYFQVSTYEETIWYYVYLFIYDNKYKMFPLHPIISLYLS